MTEFAIKTWENAIDGVAKAFAEKYFPRYTDDAFWISETGGMYCVSDQFFDAERMLQALQLDVTFEKLQEHYDAETEHYGEDPDAVPPFKSLEVYIKSGG